MVFYSTTRFICSVVNESYIKNIMINLSVTFCIDCTTISSIISRNSITFIINIVSTIFCSMSIIVFKDSMFNVEIVIITT